MRDLYYAGGTGGTLYLNGTGNAPCTNTTLKNNLINVRGWNVYTNGTPYTVYIGTGSLISSYSVSFNSGIGGAINQGQTFSTFSPGALQSASIQLQKFNSPNFNIQLKLYDQLDGLPNNELATSTNSINASSLSSTGTGSLVNFTFNNYVLTGSISHTGSYALGLVYSNVITHDDANCINWYGTGSFSGTSSAYPYGNNVYAIASSPSTWYSSFQFDGTSIITLM